MKNAPAIEPGRGDKASTKDRLSPTPLDHQDQGRLIERAQARVYDVADPDRHGTIIRAGFEVSEVRFDDGAERNIPNAHLGGVEASTDTDELDYPTHPAESPEIAAIRRGQEAWRRLRAGSTWADWVAVGMAHVIGRSTAMRDGHINKPKGRSYKTVSVLIKHANAELAAQGFRISPAWLGRGARYRLLKVAP